MLDIDSNILKSIFYSDLVGEFLRIARSSFLYKDFNETAMELIHRMKAQGTHSLRCRKALSKLIQRHEKALANFRKNWVEILTTGGSFEVAIQS